LESENLAILVVVCICAWIDESQILSKFCKALLKNTPQIRKMYKGVKILKREK
jgi:hypothetical protein